MMIVQKTTKRERKQAKEMLKTTKRKILSLKMMTFQMSDFLKFGFINIKFYMTCYNV